MSHHHDYLARRHFGSLDGLRFLCIAAVLWHHSPGNIVTEGPRLAGRGFVGVDLFFILSGFLITTLLLRERDRTGRISLAGFYWRRALRILPAYLLLVTALSAYWILYKGRDDLIPLVPYYYLFLANFLQDHIPLLTITWSLSVEEQYYLIWPLLLVLLPAVTRPRVTFLCALIVICLLAMLGLAQALDLPRTATQHAVFALPGISYMAILTGSLLAVMLHDPRGFRLLSGLCATRPAPLILFAILLVYLQLAPVNLMGWPALGMDVLMALCLASLVMREDHLARPVMRLRPVVRIGEISYGLYLYHLIGLHIAHLVIDRLGLGQTANAWVVTALFPLVSIAIAEISFRGFERRFLSFKGVFSGEAAPAVIAARDRVPGP